jgi:serine phosphatase RsbU (regulator of sigma subunit)
MKILVGWEDESEAETIDLLLNVNGLSAEIITDAEKFQNRIRENWTCIVLSLTFPDHAHAFKLYKTIHKSNPGVPVIGAWKQGDIAHLAKFITAGLHSHLMHDEMGSCFMLLRSMIEAAVAAVEAQQSKLLAERLREEVDSVRRLQENVIPQNLPVPEGYAIAARYEPAQIRVLGTHPVAMAGGDYYDVFQIDAEKMILLVGDASGHGVKACMSIMTMHTLIRMIHTNQYPNTADFVAEVNRSLSSNQIVQDEGGFITLLYSTLDFKRHRLAWTSAGAPIPLIQDLATNTVKLIGDVDDGGLPLAVDEDWKYEQFSCEVPAGSRLLIFTDGLDEAFPFTNSANNETNQFGLKGIEKSLQSSVSLPLDQALGKLFDDSNEFTEGAGRLDDTSVVLLERR